MAVTQKARVFEFARNDKLIAEHPCAEIKRIAYQQPALPRSTWTRCASSIDWLRQHCSEQIANYMQFVFFIGLHTSEATCLRWAKINFRKKEMLLDGATVYDEESNITNTSVA
jgi:integrase